MATRRLGAASAAAALALLLPGAVTQPVTVEAGQVAVVGDAVRAQVAYQIAATARARTVRTGATITIVGSVVTKPGNGRAWPRPVALVERKNGAWRTVARTSSTRVGAYSFTIAARGRRPNPRLPRPGRSGQRAPRCGHQAGDRPGRRTTLGHRDHPDAGHPAHDRADAGR